MNLLLPFCLIGTFVKQNGKMNKERRITVLFEMKRKYIY